MLQDPADIFTQITAGLFTPAEVRSVIVGGLEEYLWASAAGHYAEAERLRASDAAAAAHELRTAYTFDHAARKFGLTADVAALRERIHAAEEVDVPAGIDPRRQLWVLRTRLAARRIPVFITNERKA